VTAVSDTGDDLFCIDVNTAKQEEEFVGGTLAVTWSDCGDASTHAKISDLQPPTIETGSTTTILGTGVLDEDVTGATFTQVIKADGVQVASCSGDASEDVTCKLPLGIGSLTLKAQTFPLAAGTVSIPVETKLSSLIPASLAKTTSHVTAVSDTGDNLFCIDVNTAKQEEEFVGGTLAVSWSDCGDADTHTKLSDLQPRSLQTGSTTTLTGSGALDEDVEGATFAATVKADGVQIASCSGDASQDVVCKLPLGSGTISLKALTFPIKAGATSIDVDVKVSSLIPASLASVDTHTTSIASNGDKLFCMDVHTEKQTFV
jgi:hypothetical protein